MTEANSIFRNTPRKPVVELAEPLWEKQKGESKKAFDAFVIYRDAGVARSYTLVSQQLGKSRTVVERWGRTWHWVTRIAAFDREQDREKLLAEKEQRLKALARQRSIAVTMQTVAGFAAQDLLNRYRKTQELERLVAEEVAMRAATDQIVTDDDRAKIRAQKKLAMGAFDEVKMPPKDIAALFREGVHTERLVMGEPTEFRFEASAEDMLRKKISDAVTDARLNYSEYPEIPFDEHLQWAAEFAGVSVADVRAAAGLPRSGATPSTAPGLLTTSLSEPRVS